MTENSSGVQSVNPEERADDMAEAWHRWIVSQEHRYAATGEFNAPETYHRACFNAGFAAAAARLGEARTEAAQAKRELAEALAEETAVADRQIELRCAAEAELSATREALRAAERLTEHQRKVIDKTQAAVPELSDEIGGDPCGDLLPGDENLPVAANLDPITADEREAALARHGPQSERCGFPGEHGWHDWTDSDHLGAVLRCPGSGPVPPKDATDADT